nr:MAG TPA: hypothetical protein [Caudoviricetes sp.]
MIESYIQSDITFIIIGKIIYNNINVIMTL